MHCVCMLMKAVCLDLCLAVHNRQYSTRQHVRSLGRIDSVCQAPVFEGKGGLTGLRRMTDALIVHQVSKTPDTQGFSFYFLYFFFKKNHLFFFQPVLEGIKGKLGNWEHSRSKLINRHVSHNSAITITFSPLEHVEDMNSWCQIPSTAPDGCDAIDLAELGRLTWQ